MTKIKCNYHTHSLLCDGRDSMEETVITAIDKGFDTLGFSGHCFTAYDTSYCMSPEATEEYNHEISRLCRKYEGQIEILCGIEQDFGSDEPVSGYDYIIGSVHAMFPFADQDSQDNFHGYDRSRYFYVDWDFKTIEETVNSYFNGDPYAYCEHYYKMVSMLPEVTGCNIIGHFDLLTKFSEQNSWFDENNPRYIAAAENALRSLIDRDMIFEINTGAIAKKLRTSPYPSPFILRRICQLGGHIMINSDCHSREMLDCWFDEAVALAKSCGFSSVKKITAKGTEDINI